MTDVLVSAVLVSYNSAGDLAAVLPGLADHRVEVLVVDNNSHDGSREVAASFAHVTIVPMASNTGWSRGCNEGARQSRGRFIAFVNPDARPTAEQLVSLAARSAPGIASVSPRFVEADGSTSPFYFAYPGPLSGLLTFTPAGRRFDQVTGGRAMARRLYDSRPELAEQVDQPGAACLVVERLAFTASGGFDESMWLFFSDAAWCLARSREGLRHDVAWDIPVRHIGGSTVTALPSATVQRLFQRDYLAFATANYGPSGRVMTAVGLLLLGVLVPGVAAAARGDWAMVSARFALIGDILRTARGLRPRPPDG